MSTAHALKPAHETMPARIAVLADELMHGKHQGQARALTEFADCMKETTFPLSHIDGMIQVLTPLQERLSAKQYGVAATKIGDVIANLSSRKDASASDSPRQVDRTLDELDAGGPHGHVKLGPHILVQNEAC